jgi:hypothetical protein
VARNTKPKTTAARESSSAFFERLRPKFLDWQPPTDEQKALDVQARKDAREAELKRVLDLQKAREASKVRNRKP